MFDKIKQNMADSRERRAFKKLDKVPLPYSHVEGALSGRDAMKPAKVAERNLDARNRANRAAARRFFSAETIFIGSCALVACGVTVAAASFLSVPMAIAAPVAALGYALAMGSSMFFEGGVESVPLLALSSVALGLSTAAVTALAGPAAFGIGVGALAAGTLGVYATHDRNR